MKSDLDEMRNGVEALIINVRHAACTQCKVADETFAKVAKQIAKAKSDSWKRKIRLALVDARMERPLARYLGASCAKVPPDCRHFVFGPLGQAEMSLCAYAAATMRLCCWLTFARFPTSS